MELKDVNNKGFQGVDAELIHSEEVRRTNSEQTAAPTTETGQAITEGQARAVLARAGVGPHTGSLGRTGAYQNYVRAVDAAVGERLKELEGLLPPARLVEMEKWIKGTMYESGKVAFKV